jgi:WD40 repeat protein
MRQRFAILERRAVATLDDYVRDIAWSPDGNSLAVAGGDGGIYLARRDGTALQVSRIGEHALGAIAVAWPVRGEAFATSGQDGALALWRADSGTAVKRWHPAKSWTEHLAWTPDGRLLASAAGRSVSLWSAAGERLHEIADHAATVVALCWDKPGRDLGVAHHGGLRIHRVELQSGAASPRVTTREYPWRGANLTVSFSPNGKVLATGTQDGAAHFWYLATGRDSQMRGYGARVGLTCWSSNSRYLATSAGPEVVVWDFGGKGPEGSRPAQLVGHTDRIECMAWQPSGQYLASGGRDWRLSLWAPGKAAVAVDAHMTSAAISVVRWSPDSGVLAVGDAQGALSLFELAEAPR